MASDQVRVIGVTTDDVVRPVSGQAYWQRLCDVLLLASSAQTGPTFTRRGVCGHAGPRFRDVKRRLLQCHSRGDIQVYHRQAPASYECRCSRRHRHAEVRSRTHQSAPRRTALDRRSRAGAIIAVCNGPPLSATQGTTLHGRLLHPYHRHCPSSAPAVHRLPSSACIPRHRRSIFGRRAFSVAGPVRSGTRYQTTFEIRLVLLTLFVAISKLLFSLYTSVLQRISGLAILCAI